MRPPDFHGLQACAAHADLFSDRRNRNRERLVVCRRCPVIPECFAWSVERECTGFWAGLSARERGQVRDRYGIKFAPPIPLNDTRLELAL